jgi:hypothetical protein
MLTEHTIRTTSNSTKKVKIGRKMAIKLFCTECLGYETHPKDCTALLCPLFPFRGKTLLAYDNLSQKECTNELKSK